MALHDNGDGTVTMTNGIVSMTIVKRTAAAFDSAVYVHSNSGTLVTTETLKGKIARPATWRAPPRRHICTGRAEGSTGKET